MNALQQKWVEALESGEYKQTTDVLKRGDSYCCLGVACKVMGLEETPTGFKYEGQISTSFIPFGAWQNLGLCGHNGHINGRPSLSSQNDSGKSFTEIAKFIRDNESDVFE